MSKRREFTRNQKAEILRRATIGNEVWCEGCGLNLTGKAFEFDHRVAENLILDKSRKLTVEDGQLLGRDCCHKPKTKIDTKVAAKTKSVEAKHHGFQRKPKNQIKSAGFPKVSKKPKTPAATLPPRRLYEVRT